MTTSFDPEFRCGNTVRNTSASDRQKNWFRPKHGRNGTVTVRKVDPATLQTTPEHKATLIRNAMYSRY